MSLKNLWNLKARRDSFNRTTPKNCTANENPKAHIMVVLDKPKIVLNRIFSANDWRKLIQTQLNNLASKDTNAFVKLLGN